MKIKSLIAALAVLASTNFASAQITGAGATFPYPVYAKWADAYQKETGIAINYQSVGSGAGIKQIQQKTVTFGATDMPLNAADLEASGLVQFPTVIGGNVPVINVDGIASGDLILDGATLAKIFLGEITYWDDAMLKKLNPQLRLPHQVIVTVHRSDGSGTTFIWTDYLSKVSTDWKSKVGAGTAVEWPVGVGAKGNEGVAGNVGQTKGSIGYVEYAYVKQAGLTYAKMVNKSGRVVAPAAEAFQAAAAGADWVGTPGFGVILTDQTGEKSWPISGATFILMYKNPADPVASAAALKFFAWAYANGSKMAEDLAYVPLPTNLVSSIQEIWQDQIKDASGPIFRK